MWYNAFKKEIKYLFSKEKEERVENMKTIWNGITAVFDRIFIARLLFIIGLGTFLGPSIPASKAVEERCMQNLEDSVKKMKNEMVSEVEHNMSMLSLAGKEFMKEDSLYERDLLPAKLTSLQEISIFQRIDILYPDHQLLLQTGEERDVSGIMSFTEISQKGEHVSEYVTDIENEDISVFRCYVPVLKDNETVAVLVGILDETSFAKLCDNQRNVCIVNCEDGTLVLDNWPDAFGSMEEMVRRETKSGYEDVNFLLDIRKERTGITAHASDEGGDYTYLCYTPVKILGCELLVFEQEDTLLADCNKMEQIHIWYAIAGALIMLAYYGIVSNYENRLKKSEAVAKITENISSVLLDCSDAMSCSPDPSMALNQLMKIMVRQWKGNSAYIFEIDYDTYTISNTYLYSIMEKRECSGQLQNVPLDVFRSWMIRSNEPDVACFPVTTNQFGEGSKLNSLLLEERLNRVIVMPLIKEQNIIGFVVISDVDYVEPCDIPLIRPMTNFVISGLRMKKREGVMESYFEDSLTKMYNENRFKQVVDNYRGMITETLGVAYFCLKGLQIVDGKLDSKDEGLVKNAAGNITYIFAKQSFRIDYNKFAVIVSDMSRARFEKEIKDVCQLMEMSGIELSVGMSWHEKDANIVMQMYEAENNVYNTV